MNDDDEGGWYTGWGGLTYERRAALRELWETRVDQLLEQRVDARLVDAVWGWRSPLLDGLMGDVRDVTWLDELTLDDDREAGSVPLANVRAHEVGIVAREGRIYRWGPGFEHLEDESWAWEALLEDGWRAMVARGVPEGALDELELLGGPALRAWAHSLAE
ncbi:MAG: hypothetical protein KC656_17435 [Myxococcales bacterium]|nr:hypothetical protein [Myxococcales bacterium]MCB9668627.1 hypothetical protein [Alphaproteobacteria bacterium]MCB9690867.1 hypothetical protein [Alphaproteobacteria bacterium]